MITYKNLYNNFLELIDICYVLKDIFMYLYITINIYTLICSQMSVYNNPTLPHTEVEISNTLQIDPQVDDLELAMRFSTGIKNGDVFYTDVNGMQVSLSYY